MVGINERQKKKADTISGFPDLDFLPAGNMLESLIFDNKEHNQHFVNFGKWLLDGHFEFFSEIPK